MSLFLATEAFTAARAATRACGFVLVAVDAASCVRSAWASGLAAAKVEEALARAAVKSGCLDMLLVLGRVSLRERLSLLLELVEEDKVV